MNVNRVCFTGHRPEKLKRSREEIVKELKREIEEAVEQGAREFISGMARGVDLWAASLVLEQKKRKEDIKLICAIPFQGFEDSWSEGWRKLFREILEAADEVEVFFPSFTYRSFSVRNRWMVDRSQRIIAVYHGEKGGTLNTLEYAKKRGLDLRILRGE